MTTTQPRNAGNGCSRSLSLRMLAIVLAGFGLLLSVTNDLAQNNCIDDVTGRINDCTANDVRIDSAMAADDPVPICTPDAQIMIHVRWKLVPGPDRYDIGLFVAKDGGTARTGLCNHDYLPPPLVCDPGSVDPNSGSGPYWNAECSKTPNDACGDIQAGVATYRDDVITITCKDTNGDRKTDVGTCTSWNQTKGSTPECLGVDDTKPGSTSKCDCEQITIDDLCFATPEVCDGIDNDCDGTVDNGGALCADDGNACTNEVCNGAGGCSHPSKAAGTACGDPSSGPCDASDTCNGSGVCQSNHAASGTNCGDAGTECTNQDTCGAGGACHDNGFKAAGTACGDSSSGQCDAADTCNGSGACQPNHAASATNCGDAGTECTNQDTCDANGACVDNGFKTAGTACGDPSSGQCARPDTCNVSGACAANHATTGTNCGDAGTECTNQDT